MDVLVHGGAGGAPREPGRRQAVLDDAAATGAAAATPTEAVIEAVRVLEASPRFNAGRGGTIQTDGAIRTDAGVMTSDRAVGAVCNVPGCVHPSTLAAYIKDETPHVLLGPEGAIDIAHELGVEVEADLSTKRLRERFEEAEVPGSFRGQLEFVREAFGDGGDGPHAFDTVGAVATDGDTLAACTSTGGRWLALRGRVGDVPQIGCGFYCSPAGAVSTTGAGEDIARVTLARDIERRLERGVDAQTAAIDGIAAFERATDATAGVIVIQADGSIGTAFNSTRMQTAHATR